jgi:RNA polymerase sigma factor (sigma-70 family)
LICPAKSAQELLAEFRSTGQQQPFEEIVRRYAAMVFHVCFQVLKNRHDAEDATQAVFLTLAVQGKTNKEIRNIGPWLGQVAKRLSLDLRKARKRRLAREHRHGISNSNGDNGLALGSGLDGQELRHILSEELNQLSPKYRLPLILHYFGGLSREQMSQELGCKEATLGVRLHRGREMLAARLSQRGVTLTATGLGLLLAYMVREAVTENLIWSTSHVATQMAAGHPIGAGMVSARAMVLARTAGNTLAVAKVKAIVASVLIAATAVAAGEVVSKVRPMDFRLQGPGGDRLLDLLRPKLPQLRSDATPPQQEPTAPAVQIVTNENPVPVVPKIIVAADPSVVFQPPTGADWGGSILSGQWIGSATNTHIPGIAWSNPVPTSGSSLAQPSRGYAVGPIAAPAVRQGSQQPVLPFIASPSTVGAPYATAPQKPRRAVQNPATPEMRMELAPANEPPPPPMDIVATGPKLFLEPAAVDGRSHPAQPPTAQVPGNPIASSTAPPVTVVTASGQAMTLDASSFQLSGNGVEAHFNSVALSPNTNLNVRIVTNSVGDDADFHIHKVTDLLSRVTDVNIQIASDLQYSADSDVGFVLYLDGRANQVRPRLNPVVLARSAFEGVSTVSTGSGVIKGYGTAQSASELNHNGQMIADGSGQERTLDLSAVRVIKNSIENARTGHNGWFAQNKGKLTLPAVAINNGRATWGEDSNDSQLDLINSVRLSVNSDVVGRIKLSLLATDRTDYPALPGTLKPIGLWQVEPIDLVLADLDVMVRYDVDLASDLHLNGELNLWGFDGEWKLADARSVDSHNRLVRGQLGNIDYFAVAGSVQAPLHINGTPEPAAMLGLVCAGLMLARRRRRSGCAGRPAKPDLHVTGTQVRD